MAEAVEKDERTEKHSERVVYELGYHIVPKTGEEQLPKTVATIKEKIEKLGGVFIADEFPAHVTLAYTMVRAHGGKREKFASSYFGWVKFEMGAEHANPLTEWLHSHEPVLRFILFRTVREDTRAPKRVTVVVPKPSEPIRPKLTTAPKKDKSTAEQVSDEELDRTIEELVVE
ncbi:MAG TPA: hypothetical protein VGA06_01010 [Candidatus Paceibacterota bacterium]